MPTHAHAECSCRVSVPHAHAEYSCRVSVLNALAECPCWISILDSAVDFCTEWPCGMAVRDEFRPHERLPLYDRQTV